MVLTADMMPIEGIPAWALGIGFLIFVAVNTGIIKLIVDRPNKHDKELQKSIESVKEAQCYCQMQEQIEILSGRVTHLEECELTAISYRLYECIDKINNKLDSGRKDISGNVVNLVMSRKAFQNMGGNGDFDPEYSKVVSRIKKEAPDSYKVISGLR